jgi:3-keto-disaccharide hydrolase
MVLSRWAVMAALATFTSGLGTAGAQSVPPCPQHARDCPAPPVIDAGPPGAPVPFPSDALVLFDGKSLSEWRSADGSPARWVVRSGYMEVAAGTGGIATVRRFGDVQLHVEWASPNPPKGTDQDRGNSGVFLMGRYEVQVLDSYGNTTYPDGQAGAVYGQYPPLVNASRAPGVWQTYDIVFHRPRFAADGSLLHPATLTVFHNGVLIQDGVTLTGPTAHQSRPAYTSHPDRLPISLQDHAHPVRFRNIWVRELER